MTFLERPVTGSTLLAVAAAAGGATLWVGDSLAGASVVVLWAIWWVLPTADGPPILGLAMMLASLVGACDGVMSACVYNAGHGPCEEWVPRETCEGGGGVYHDATTCSALGMVKDEPPQGSE